MKTPDLLRHFKWYEKYVMTLSLELPLHIGKQVKIQKYNSTLNLPTIVIDFDCEEAE